MSFLGDCPKCHGDGLGIPCAYPEDCGHPRAEELSLYRQALIADTRSLETGWLALKLKAVSPAATVMQYKEMRMAFYAGALHLFTSLWGVTDGDLRERMESIQKELDRFVEGV